MGVASLLLISSALALAEVKETDWSGDNHPEHCASAEVFQKTHDYLRDRKDLPVEGMAARKIASEVAMNCSGAFERFRVVFELLFESGLSVRQTLKTAIEYSKRTDSSTKVFVDSFKYLYLEKYLDVNIQVALELAHELASSWQGADDQVGRDFVQTVEFCLDPKALNLSQKECFDLSLRIARLSQFFPQGAFKAFQDLYSQLRQEKKYGLSVGSALDVALKVTAQGPKGAENFLAAYDYAISPKGLNESADFALKHALKLVDYSNKNGQPPRVYR